MPNPTDSGQAPPYPTKAPGTPPGKGLEPDGNVQPPQKKKIVAGAVIGAAVADLNA